MMFRLTKVALIEYIAVVLVLLTSGTYIWYHELTPAIACLIYLAFAIYYRIHHSMGGGIGFYFFIFILNLCIYNCQFQFPSING